MSRGRLEEPRGRLGEVCAGLEPGSLVHQHRPEIFEAGGRRATGGRGIQREKDRRSFVAVERHDPIVSGEGLAKLQLECLVVDQARETQDAPVGNVEAAEEHSSSVLLFVLLGRVADGYAEPWTAGPAEALLPLPQGERWMLARLFPTETG
jgi:hypothetical protein